MAAGDAQITPTANHSQAPDADTRDESRVLRDKDQGEDTGKKRRKPKKKAKHLPLLPSVMTAEDRLAWKLEQTARLGRHAVAKQAVAAGQLLLSEKPVATVIRAQYAASSCHMCLKELPAGHSAVEVAPALLRGAQQYKRYCSPACAAADTHAALTAPVHGRLTEIAAAAQADPQLLHLLLELDSRRIVSPPALHVSAEAGRGWVLSASAAAGPKTEGKHKSSNGHPGECSHPETHTVSSGMSTNSAAADAASAIKSDGAPSHGVNGGQEKGQDGGQQTIKAAHPGLSQAAEPPGTKQPKQSKGADSSAGTTGEPPTMQCTLEDVLLLTAHSDNNTPAWHASVGRAVEGMQQAMRDSRAFEPSAHSHYMALAARVSNNAHGTGVANATNIDRGLGMWPGVSMLNHSCRPNCFFAWHGGALEVRAVRSIRKGEQLTVSYINPTEPRRIRAMELMASKYFMCVCERCTEPIADTPDMMLEAVRCRQGRCEGYLLEQRRDNMSEGDHWVCTGCSRSVPSFPPANAAKGSTVAASTQPVYPGAMTDRFRRAWSEAMNLIQTKGHAAAKPALDRVLMQAQEALHPMHAVIVDCLMPLVNCSRATQDSTEAIRYLQQLLAALEVIIGCHSVELGNLYGLLGQLYQQRGALLPAALQARCKKQAREACSRALAIYATCLGESHELCQEQMMRMLALR